jgi:AraC-like DNA-binding protein
MKQVFTALIEHKSFRHARPWSLVRQTFTQPTISPPHYAETIEILVCKGIIGVAHINGATFDMSGDRVFFIAPQIVHSFEYQASEGTVLAVKWHPELMKDYLSLEKILEQHALSIPSIAVVHENLEDFYPLAEKLDSSSDTVTAIAAITAMLALFIAGTRERDSSAIVVEREHGSVLNAVIAWTEQNYSRRIALGEVAREFGYTKNYFCELFKSGTGITYLTYLNHVRITNACALLRKGLPVYRVRMLCGFETDSYFIALFKRTVGITPKAYQSR